MLSHIALGMVTAIALARMYQYKKQALEIAKLARENRQIYTEREARYTAQIEYLVHMLNRHGIQPTEFDMIAYNELIK